MKKFLGKIIIAGLMAVMVPVAVACTPAVAYEVKADIAIEVLTGDSFVIEAQNPTDSATYRITPDVAVTELSNTTVSEGDTYKTELTLVIEEQGDYVIDVLDADGQVIETCDLHVADDLEDDTAGEGDGESTDGTGSEGEEDPDISDYPRGDVTYENAPEEDSLKIVIIEPVGGYIECSAVSDTEFEGETFAGVEVQLTPNPDEGWSFIKWVFRNEHGDYVTDQIDIDDNGVFIMPDYSISVSAEFSYTTIGDIEVVGATTSFEVGDKFVFTGSKADKTDPRYFILAEVWTNLDGTKGITSSKAINDSLISKGYTITDEVEDHEEYYYSVILMANDGYSFADDIVLKFGDEEIEPDGEGNVFGGGEGGVLSFSDIVSFGETVEDPDDQIHESNTKVDAANSGGTQIIRKTGTDYEYRTVTYTTYEYVTVVRPANSTTRMVRRNVTSTKAPSTGDKNSMAVWIALGIAGASGLISGIAVAKRRKKNR